MSIQSIHKKLFLAQQGFGRLMTNNRADRYKYADLSAVLDLILPQLHQQGLFLHQKTITADNAVVVETVVYDENGNSVSGGQLLMPTAGLIQRGAQAFGSALTYARRYSLTAFFCLYAEDDDGNIASRPVQSKAPAKEPEPQELDIGKVETAFRNCSDLSRLENLYQNAMKRAKLEQTAQISAVYEQVKHTLEEVKKADEQN